MSNRPVVQKLRLDDFQQDVLIEGKPRLMEHLLDTYQHERLSDNSLVFQDVGAYYAAQVQMFLAQEMMA